MKNLRKNLKALTSNDIESIHSILFENFGTVFHEPEFNAVVETIFKTKFYYNLLYNREGKLIALCPLHLIKQHSLKMVYSNPTIYEVPYGGWVYNENEISLEKLISRIKLFSNEALIYTSIPQVKVDEYKNVPHTKVFQTPIIELDYSLDEIFSRYISKNTRRNIKRAPRKGISIEKLNLENFHVFMQLFKSLKKTVGLPFYSDDFYIEVLKQYHLKDNIAVFASKLNGEYLSGIIVIGNINMMHAWLAGRAGKIPKNVYQNELLWWETIKWAKQRGARYYDLCVVEPERLPNIAQFKLGFSKVIVPFYFIQKRSPSYRIIARCQKLIRSGKDQ